MFQKLLFSVSILLGLTITAQSQNNYNANFQPLKFGGTGVTITNKVGNGTSAGDIVLYQNVITIGTQNIDCIVKTVSINNGSFTTYDQSAASGTGFSGNQAQWFSPQLTFNSGGGNVVFQMTLILGGTFNNTTKTGSRITLNNVRINTYDIDGNGNTNSNQFNEFGGFSTSELANPTNITPTYNASLGLTKYRSNLSANTTDATDVKNRVRVTYNYMSDFNISVGAGANGAAYFFLDFSTGSTFTSAVSTAAPELDLNTVTTGINNDTTLARNGNAKFTTGQTNIANPSNVVNSFKVNYSFAQVPDSAMEFLNFVGATSGGSYPLFFTSSGATTNMVLHGNTYTVNRTINGGSATYSFAKQGGTSLNNAQAESFIDAMVYQNTKTSPTLGNRSFAVSFTNATFESAPATFTLNLAQPLPVTWKTIRVVKKDEQSATINWSTASEVNSDFFEPMFFSNESSTWISLGKIVAQNKITGGEYTFNFNRNNQSSCFLKIKQVDFDGNFSYSPTQKVEFEKINSFTVNLVQNSELIEINSSQFGSGKIIDQLGRPVVSVNLKKGDNQYHIGELNPGVYWLVVGSESVKFIKY